MTLLECISPVDGSIYAERATLDLAAADAATHKARAAQKDWAARPLQERIDPGFCWTGCKNTGRGGGLSEIGYQNLTRPKSYLLKKVTS